MSSLNFCLKMFLLGFVGFIFIVPAYAETISAKIKLDHETAGVAVNLLTNKIYVGSSNFLLDNDKNFVTEVSGLFHELNATVDLGEPDPLFTDIHVAVNQVADKIYAFYHTKPEENADALYKLSIINGKTFSILETKDVGFNTEIAVDSLGNKIYLHNTSSVDPTMTFAQDEVVVLEGNTNETLTTIDLMTTSVVIGLIVNSKTNKVYLLELPNKLIILDGSSDTLLNKVDLPQLGGESFAPISLALNSVTNRLYISVSSQNKILVFDLESNSVVGTINAMSPLKIAVNETTNRIYFYDNIMNAVCVVDGATNKIVDVIILGGLPNGIAVNSETNKVYVSNALFNKLFVIDGSITASTPIKDQVRNAVNELINTQERLTEGTLSKKAGRLINKINSLLNASPNKCKKISVLLKQLDKVITRIDNKIESNIVDRVKKDDMDDGCIPPGLFEGEIEPLRESFSIIESTFTIDEDRNKVPDVCEKNI